MKRWIYPLMFAAALQAAAPAAWAMNPHPRDGWFGGVSIGFSQGSITLGNDVHGKTPEGISPQWRIGRMLGHRFGLSLNYEGWLVEGNPRGIDEGIIEERLRSSLQGWQLALTYFPGNPETAAGGMYLRGGVGYALAGFAQYTLDENLEQDQKSRLDESGVSFNLAAGYEIRATRHFATGLSLGVNYLSIGKDLYDKAWFFPISLNFVWYF